MSLVRLGAFTMFVAACGSNPPPAPPPATATATASSTGDTSTIPKLRLGHYSSADGLVGIVLDRSGAVPKLRIDGEPEVVTLEMRRTSHTSYDLINHDKHVGVSVDDEGRVIYSRKGLQGGNREMFRDADAQPL